MRVVKGVAAAMVCLLIATTPALAKRVALVIGNSAYQSVSELANPKNDAAAVADALTKIGFDEVLRRNDLDQRTLLKTLREFADLSAGAETAVIYFAGHGVEVDNRNYLVPTDATLAKAADVEFEAVPLDTVRTAVSAASKLRLVILDACRNNPFKMASGESMRSVGRGLARVEPSSNELIAYSAKEGTIAADGDGANSPYTAALIKHLAEPGLEINFLFRRVRDDVVAATGRTQEPFTYGTLGAEEVYLSRPSGSSPAATDMSASSEWPLVEHSNSREVLEAYLQRHSGNEFYSALAREVLASLGDEPGAKSEPEAIQSLPQEEALPVPAVKTKRLKVPAVERVQPRQVTKSKPIKKPIKQVSESSRRVKSPQKSVVASVKPKKQSKPVITKKKKVVEPALIDMIKSSGGLSSGGSSGGGSGGGGWSDLRLKTGVIELATLDNGLTLYSFNYIWDRHTSYVGVMAQDLIAEGRSDAVVATASGYYKVDYAALGMKMTTLDEFLRRGMASVVLQ